jgi:hypothetical protein
MPSSPVEPVDLLDLKLLPAWVKEPSEGKSYAHYEGHESDQRPRARDGRFGQGRQKPGRDRRPARAKDGQDRPPGGERRRPAHGARPARGPRHAGGYEARDREEDRQKVFEAIAGQIAVRFLPHPPAFENVVGQIKSSAVAYSIFSLARLFLEKPERYDVQLTAKPGFSLYRLGENGTLSADRQFLENNAFRFAQEDFYKVDVTQSEPIKGNFSSVARCRLSDTLLGPTNHHGYQPRLRNLYEQCFSRRMSFAEYQRQIEIVTDPAVVEQWKEDARNVTSFTTLHAETPSTFGSATDVERHFRQNYLPDLVRNIEKAPIDGVTSRQMPDRALRRLIEDAWSKETRSPSQIMQELAKSLREAGLQIFRHRRGMLFVSPIRVHPFAHDQTTVSPQIKGILETLTANPKTNRKELADKLLGDIASEDAESRKLALASDLHWLISEGYVIEFNDGSLDMPRVKAKPPEEKPEDDKAEGGSADADVRAAETTEPLLAATTEQGTDAQ